MPDKKLTDNEIVKAFKICNNLESGYCSDCSYEYYDSCIRAVATDTLDLINRLEARIGIYETCNARKDEAIKHLEAENKRLSAEICGQKEANLFLINDKEKAINGAIKKFCDILKKRINNEPLVFFEQRHIVYDEIDNLVKEMVGEDK